MQEKVTTSGTSVNENLLSGPDLTNQFIRVLEKFRVGPVAFMTNKQAMFSRKTDHSQDSYGTMRLSWILKKHITKCGFISLEQFLLLVVGTMH